MTARDEFGHSVGGGLGDSESTTTFSQILQKKFRQTPCTTRDWFEGRHNCAGILGFAKAFHSASLLAPWRSQI